MYQLHPQVILHFASDQSGVLLFNGFKNQVFQYPPSLMPWFSYLQSTDIDVDFELFMQHTPTLDNVEQQEVWNSLVSQFVLIPN